MSAIDLNAAPPAPFIEVVRSASPR